MSVKDQIITKLTAAFSPAQLEVTDDSHHHAGHSGNPDGKGETHFSIKMISAAFSGKGRIERHRMVNNLLAQELKDGIHALAISVRAPDEAGS